MSEIKIPSRFSYDFLIKFVYNFERSDHSCYYRFCFRLVEMDAAKINYFLRI